MPLDSISDTLVPLAELQSVINQATAENAVIQAERALFIRLIAGAGLTFSTLADRLEAAGDNEGANIARRSAGICLTTAADTGVGR